MRRALGPVTATSAGGDNDQLPARRNGKVERSRSPKTCSTEDIAARSGPIAARKLSATTGVGTHYTVTAKIGPLKVSSPYEVTPWEPPRRFGGSGIAGPVKFDERYTLTQTDSGTALTQTMTSPPRGPFRLIEVFLMATDRVRGASATQSLGDGRP